jgi:hypothetical protein
LLETQVGNAQNYTSDDWKHDIQLAQQAHIDAFAMNVAYKDDSIFKSLETAFNVADNLGFHLFFSFDYPGGPAPWPSEDVYKLASTYTGRGSYYNYKGQPMISTFEGPENANDWKSLKIRLNCFFIPSWSSLGAQDAVKLGVADGLFSWAAWAYASKPVDTYVDASYKQFLGDKPYMMPASPWFYTNLPGYGKNCKSNL